MLLTLAPVRISNHSGRDQPNSLAVVALHPPCVVAIGSANVVARSCGQEESKGVYVLLELHCAKARLHYYFAASRKIKVPVGLISATPAHELKHGKEDINRIEVDGERERDCRLPVSSGSNARKVADGQQGENS